MGAIIAIHHYGTAQDFDALERWEQHLIAVAEGLMGREDGEIQSVLVFGYGVAAVHARKADHVRYGQWNALFEEGVNRLGLHDLPRIVQIRERLAGEPPSEG